MSLTHIWDDCLEDDLLQSSKMFWENLIDGCDISFMIAPDCRIASGFFQRAIGVNGVDNCSALLAKIQTSLVSAEVDREMHNLMIMKTGTQTRFYILGLYKSQKFALCFALEWCNGIIVGIVIVKDKHVPKDFLRDDLDFCYTANGTLGRRESLCADYSKQYFFMGGTLDPPFHMPIPPVKLATVVITVLNCKNLKSRLKRIIPRKLNPQVIVEFDGRRQQTTVVTNSADPVFATGEEHCNPFVFEIPDTLDERDPNACVKFLVEDVHKFGFGTDRLAAVKVPLAAIKCVSNEARPMKLTIPLVLRRRHFGIRERVGILTKNDNITVSRPDDHSFRSVMEENSSMALSVLISKCDDLRMWLLKELQLRDEAWCSEVLSTRDNTSGVNVDILEEGKAANNRKPADDEHHSAKIYPYFLWSLSKDSYDTADTI